MGARRGARVRRAALGVAALGALLGAARGDVPGGPTWSALPGSAQAAGGADGLAGFSVAVSSSGARVAVGAPGSGAPGAGAGEAYVYEQRGDAWELLASLPNDVSLDSGDYGGKFGRSVAISGDGKRVAVAAPGHATIAHCLATALDKIEGDVLCVKVGSRRRATADDPETALAQRSNVITKPRWDAKLAKELQTDLPVLLGATAWALARDDAVGTFDYLFVDEAGQVPAANLAAMASCASRIVLLGDQAQLPAPCRGARSSSCGPLL